MVKTLMPKSFYARPLPMIQKGASNAKTNNEAQRLKPLDHQSHIDLNAIGIRKEKADRFVNGRSLR